MTLSSDRLHRKSHCTIFHNASQCINSLASFCVCFLAGCDDDDCHADIGRDVREGINLDGGPGHSGTPSDRINHQLVAKVIRVLHSKGAPTLRGKDQANRIVCVTPETTARYTFTAMQGACMRKTTHLFCYQVMFSGNNSIIELEK